MRFENFSKMESDEGIRKEHDEQIYGYDLDDVEIFNRLNNIQFHDEIEKKMVMKSIIEKATSILKLIEKNKFFLSHSSAFSKIRDLSIVSKYANLNIDEISDKMLNREEFNKQILDTFNNLYDFLDKLVVYEMNKFANFNQEIDAGGMKR